MIERLQNIIRQCGGSISYSDYMEEALYGEDSGYYMKNRAKIGKKGDFYTASNHSDFFARHFARLFSEWTKGSGIPPYFCEIGGGTGAFAKAFLNALPEFDVRLDSMISLEKSSYHSSLQEALKMEQLRELNQLPEGYKGVIFSNELYDAFPVDVIQKKNGTLWEVRVALDNAGKLKEKMVPLSNPLIKDYLTWLNLSLKEGYRYEVPLHMLSFMEKINAKTDSAIIIMIDYGYYNEELMNEVHKEGSLRGYYQHVMVNDPLMHPYNMDLTVHIHFDAYKKKAEEKGWEILYEGRQNDFLWKTGFADYLIDCSGQDPFSIESRHNRAISSLLAGNGLSQAFHVFIHGKNLTVPI
ncbi:SAM-dependent methyltransferase [Metabacillus sp. RGM 3146]|uniref:SAM-dependent methyltransferase n=1 Tax=Metabacillus sp. RGM 3146 TaxID=3401092 RepID=UPI003B9D9B6A